ncbi:YceI family protein [Salisaeta longa]|uniref:YceI family protein n=1 Tax=Salisaeta longa TaxID=503170 RepID=UPI0003B6BD75|nr:YceI family protein [Salisaeta longa]
MLRILLSILASGILFIGASPPPAAPTPYTILPDHSTLTIAGTSTLHDWTCDVQSFEGTLRAAPADSSAAAVAAISGGQLRVPVAAIECGKDRMNNNLRDALRAEAYPTIFYMIESAELTALPDSAGAWSSAQATGTLIIGGTRHKLTVPGTVQRQPDGQLRIVGDVSFKMSTWGVEPPSVMLGTITTGDRVTIGFDILAAPSR